MKLRHFNQATQSWESVAPSQKEFDDFATSTNLTLADTATKAELQLLQNNVVFADIRTIVFIVLKEVDVGIQDAHISFPFDGEILEMSASCSQTGTADSSIRVERSSNMQTWNSITTNSLTIPVGSFFDDKTYVLFNPNVNKGDIFRVVVDQSGDIQNLTVNVKIKIKN